MSRNELAATLECPAVPETSWHSYTDLECIDRWAEIRRFDDEAYKKAANDEILPCNYTGRIYDNRRT
jgi:hypothetical protein